MDEEAKGALCSIAASLQMINQSAASIAENGKQQRRKTDEERKKRDDIGKTGAVFGVFLFGCALGTLGGLLTAGLKRGNAGL